MAAVSKEQLDILLAYCRCERDKALISFLWHSGVRVSEAARVTAKDFNWDEGTVIVLGKGNCYRKALAGNGIVKDWFSEFVQILSSGLLGVFDEFLKTCV